MLVNTNLEREREGLSRLEDPNRRVAKAKKEGAVIQLGRSSGNEVNQKQ